MSQSVWAAPGHVQHVWERKLSAFMVKGAISVCMQGLVVSGGAADAFGTEPWILHLKKVLQEEHGRGQRILGVCFGHQVLAEALGGRAGAHEPFPDVI